MKENTKIRIFKLFLLHHIKTWVFAWVFFFGELEGERVGELRGSSIG